MCADCLENEEATTSHNPMSLNGLLQGKQVPVVYGPNVYSPKWDRVSEIYEESEQDEKLLYVWWNALPYGACMVEGKVCCLMLLAVSIVAQLAVSRQGLSSLESVSQLIS
jgi:hypothetical protein